MPWCDESNCAQFSPLSPYLTYSQSFPPACQLYEIYLSSFCIILIHNFFVFIHNLVFFFLGASSPILSVYLSIENASMGFSLRTGPQMYLFRDTFVTALYSRSLLYVYFIENSTFTLIPKLRFCITKDIPTFYMDVKHGNYKQAKKTKLMHSTLNTYKGLLAYIESTL